MKKLTLYNGPNSPFGRKTKITAIVLEIPIEEKIIKIQEAEFIDNFNPLRKIPTLVIDDEQTIIDRTELIRPSNEQSKSFVKKQEVRVFRTIDWLEKNWNNFENTKISIDQISVACALEYTKFRFTDKWANNCKNLNNWLEEFNKNSFMELTIPKDA